MRSRENTINNESVNIDIDTNRGNRTLPQNRGYHGWFRPSDRNLPQLTSNINTQYNFTRNRNIKRFAEDNQSNKNQLISN